MERIIKLLFLSILLGMKVNGQHIQKHRDFYYMPKADTVFMTTYIINNDSKNNLFLWFGMNKDKSAPQEYFYKMGEDYSLLEILNEETIRNKRFDIVGQTFIKQIKWNEKFIISVLYKSRENWLANSFDENLIVMNENKLPNSIKSALNRNEEYFYDSEFISLFFDLMPNVRKPAQKVTDR